MNWDPANSAIRKAINGLDTASVSLRAVEEHLKNEKILPEIQDRLRQLAEEALDVVLRVREEKGAIDREQAVSEGSEGE